MNILIYSKSNCPNCVSAKQLLKANSLGYEEKNAEDPVTWLELLGKYPQVRQMPQIFIDGQRVGGLEGLKAALKQLGITPSA
jgi:glutaredoxin 3